MYLKFITLTILFLSVILAQISLNELESIIAPCGTPNTIAQGENIKCDEALPHINSALQSFDLNNKPLMAMYLSTISLESGKLSFNKNHYPGRPGQGTRGMLMPDNLQRFLNDNKNNSKVNLNKELLNYANNNNRGDAEQILNLLMDNKYSFLPAAWFIKSGCPNSYENVKSGDRNRITDYLTNCLGGSDVSGRYSLYLEALSKLE